MFNEFPYANFHELNLDWIIKKVKEAYSPDNPPEGIVLSVNGEDGNVILYQDAIVRFPDVQDGTWNVHRIAGGASSGIQFTPTKAQRISGANRYDMYDSNNPPPYPVTSVNGQTGNVNIQIPVQSVNGQTGVVVIPPDFTSGDEIMEFTQESEGNYWGLSRTVSTGNASIYLDTSNNTVKAYISFNSTDGQTNVTYPLLTSADIPSSSGVISINAKTGAVTLYGTDIYTSENSQTTVAQDLASHGNSIASLQQTQTEDHTSLIQTRSQLSTAQSNITNLQGRMTTAEGNITTNSTNLSGEINRAKNAEQNIMESVAILVSGDSSSTGASVGQYVYVKGSTITGITDGLYKASQAIPANTSIDSTYLTAVSGGGLNSLNDSIATKITPVELLDTGYFTDNNNHVYSCPNWHDYYLLIVQFRYYGNVLETVTVSSDYFNVTSSGNRIIMNGGTLTVYVNDRQSVNIGFSSGATVSYRKASILGVLKR